MSDIETSPDRSSPPALPPDSPGSSVSTRMQEEYTELLKFAITTGLQDSQEPTGGELGGLEETLQTVASLGSTQKQEQLEKEDDLDVARSKTPPTALEKNSNSNNMYQDFSNESAADRTETDKNSSNIEPNLTEVTVGPDIGEMGDKLDTWLGKLKGDILGELSRTVVKSLESQQKAHQQEIKDLVSDKQRLEREATRLAEHDYEEKIKSLNMSIANLEQKVSFLQQERGQYAEQVRKAFMRGVCALNMETMSAFGPEENLDLDPSTGHSQPRTVSTGPANYQEDSLDELNYSHNANNQPLSHPSSTQELVQIDRVGAVQQQEQQQQQQLSQQQHQHRKEPRSLPMAEVQITSGVIDSGTVGVQPRSLPTFTHKTKTKSAKAKGRPGTAPSSGITRHTVRASHNQNQPLAPPMASVVVERHNPVTKQTLGKATAVRYPKAAMGQVSRSQPSPLIGQSFKPLAGQSGSLTMVSSIKVVD
ncbi:centrosomal protein POC5 [Elysia marginata]|uniref:Centrosomal protein POC5 n=1 Tax=Elysia marginata TaxID=1093978 RepID=A0AAV4IVH9_9GAST|nr:centrosomal protein POC5 [Elysia marginata]